MTKRNGNHVDPKEHQHEDRDALRMAFAKCLRTLRQHRGFSQEHLAYRAGIDRSYYSELERGERTPTLETIHRLLKCLDVSFILAATEFEPCLQKELKAARRAAKPKKPR